MKRVAVVGTTNAGKTTVAAKLAKRLDVPHVEHDSLYRWAKDTHAERTARYTALMADPAGSHLTWVHLTSPRATRRWVATQPVRNR